MTRNPHRERFSVLKRLAPLVVTALATERILSATKSRPRTGHWRSPAGFSVYKDAYDEAMATLPEPNRTIDAYTEFGTVRVYEWSARTSPQREATPVVLVPGIRSGAPMWAENLPYWIGDRTIYAMDAVGDAGLSSQAIPFDSFDHQIEWLEQALGTLGVKRAHMVGHSFGGAIAATHALHHPGRVASLTLLEPVMVLHRMPLSIYLWSSALLLPVPQAWKDRALAEIGGVSVEEVRERTPVSEMVDAGSKHYTSVTLMPRRLTDTEWWSMRMPIRVEIADDKSLAGGRNAVNRAISLGLGRVLVRPDTTHSLPVQAAKELGEELETYWASYDH